jgi:2-methylcitrate dehydratase
VEDPEWTRRYHSIDPAEKAFGARVEIRLSDGEMVSDELAVADAHPLGSRPFTRGDYVAKFRALSEGVLDRSEIDRFLDLAARVEDLSPGEVRELTIQVPGLAEADRELVPGIFG